MTLMKMLDILEHLAHCSAQHGMIFATSGGEIAFELNGQPDRSVHDYLLRKGFIYHDGNYIYRPRKG